MENSGYYYGATNGTYNPLPTGWSEHLTPEGVKYYYNASTGVSTYTHPSTDISNPPTTTTPAVGATTAAAAYTSVLPAYYNNVLFNSAVAKSAEAWIEYKDEKSNKSYYYNRYTKVSVWEEPEEVRVKRAREEARKMGISVEQKKVLTSTPKVEEKKVEETTNERKEEQVTTGKEMVQKEAETAEETESEETETQKDYSKYTKEERVAEFKQMLERKKIGSHLKWNDMLKLIIDEIEFHALSTNGERKQAYAEYCTKVNKQMELETRRKKKEQRELFMKCLASYKEITSQTRWYELVNNHELYEKLEKDKRFTAIEDEIERKDLFMDYMNLLIHNEKEFYRKQKEEQYQQFKDFLIKATAKEGEEAKEGEIQITPATRYRDIEAYLMKHETFKEIPSYDLIRWFREYSDELRKEEIELKKREIEEQKKMEKRLIYQLKEKIMEQLDNAAITPFLSWKEYLPIFEQSDIYTEMTTSKLPEYIFMNAFERTLSDVRRDLRDDRTKIMAALRAANYKIIYTSTKEEYMEKLQRGTIDEREKLDIENSSIYDIIAHKLNLASKANINFIFDDMLNVQKEKHKEEEKKQAIAIEEFQDLLTEYYYRSDHLSVTWEEAKRTLEKHQHHYRKLSESIREKIFKEYMKKLQRVMDECIKTRRKSTEEEDNTNKEEKEETTKKRHRISKSKSPIRKKRVSEKKHHKRKYHKRSPSTSTSTSRSSSSDRSSSRSFSRQRRYQRRSRSRPSYHSRRRSRSRRRRYDDSRSRSISRRRYRKKSSSSSEKENNNKDIDSKKKTMISTTTSSPELGEVQEENN